MMNEISDELLDEVIEVLKKAESTARTHAMQSYSLSSANKANEIEILIKRLELEVSRF